MRARTAIVAAAVLACAAPQAFAAPKAVCLLVVDAAGDGTTAGVVPNRDSLDILSADVATGGRNLVGVLRLASVASDPTIVTGVTYTLGWRSGAADQAFRYIQYADGTTLAEFDPNTEFNASGDEVSAKVRLDSATNSLIWTVGRKSNPALAKRGARFVGFTATAVPGANLGANPASVSFSANIDAGNIEGDTASSGRSYTDLTPSCVKGV